MKRKLTELAVSKIRPPAQGRVEIWDQVLPGFGIRVGPSRRTWIAAVRRPGSKNPTRVKLGVWPQMPLADARTRARALMEGGAPEAPVAFQDMRDGFLEHGRTKKGRALRQNTADQYRRVLTRYAATLNKRPVQEINRRDIAMLISTIATKSGAPTASLVRAMLGRLFGWAIEVGYRDDNPVTGTPSYEVAKRERTLSDAELRALWTATEEATDHNLIVRICLWTGCRRGEAGGMRWSEMVDGVWLIPGERAKNHRPLALPLPRQMQDAIAAWPRFVGRDHLFGRTGPHGFTNWSKAKTQLDATLRFNQDWDLHDCRRTTETRMARLKIPKDHVNRVLNHAIGPITEAYDHHDYMPEKTAALQTWADELERIIWQGEAKVIALR